MGIISVPLPGHFASEGSGIGTGTKQYRPYNARPTEDLRYLFILCLLYTSQCRIIQRSFLRVLCYCYYAPYNIPAPLFQAGRRMRDLRRRTEIIPVKVKDPHIKIKPLALAGGHGRYITVTPERTPVSIGERPLHTAAINFVSVSLRPFHF